MPFIDVGILAIAALATASSDAPIFRNFLPNTQLVYSANVDGEIEPCGCRTNPTGGIQRRFNLLQQKVSGETLSLDSGDLFYKSVPVPPFLEKQWNYQAEVLLRAYNKLKVDVFTPGELDFADGLEQLRKLLSKANFKTVSANLYEKKSGKRLFEPYVTLIKSGKKVALFGLFDESLQLPPEVVAKDHLEAAKEMVSKLRGNADVVIALTHEGLDKDEELARNVAGIDAIFGAHTQSFLLVPEKVGETLIFQPSFRGQHVGVYFNGDNAMYQVDARFDSPADKPTEFDTLVNEAKSEIGRINKETETELVTEDEEAGKKTASFQTFPRCAECHAPQYNFHKNTPHFRAYETLVKAKQQANLECLKCHTVGQQLPGGWTNVNLLVTNSSNKTIEADSFAQSLPKMKIESLSKIGRAYINVQCENCHGPAADHPFSANYSKKVSTNVCLTCHTLERAPDWYKDGKPDLVLVKKKLKSMSCPRVSK